MMNQIKELNNKDNNEFIIEISFILIESQKKITISLFISAEITALELKEFLSKDFGFSIQNMIFVYPFEGIIKNDYIFHSEPNKKVFLDLILVDKKNDTNNLNSEINLKNRNFINYQNPYLFNNNLLNNQDKNNLFNFINKFHNNINNINSIKILPNKLINSNLKKEPNFFNNSYINFDKNKNIGDKTETKIDNKNICENNKNFSSIKEINNNNFYQIKNNKCNFVLTKIESKQKALDEQFLGKKRNIPTTFKTTILNKENENSKSKSFKIVNFNVNKNLPSQNEENKSQITSPKSINNINLSLK